MNRHLRNVALVLCLAALHTLYGQIIPYQNGLEVPLAKIDVQTAPIPAGSTTSVTFVCDPVSGGGDVFHVRVSDPAVVISLILPGGMQINSTNAVNFGFGYSMVSIGDPGKLIPTLLGDPGWDVIITMPDGQLPGTYVIQGDGTLLTTASAMTADYSSSSNVGAGLTTDAPLYRAGDTVILSASLFDGVSPITSSSISADIWNSLQINAQCTIGNYALINQQQLDANTTQYTYQASVINTGPAANDVTAILTSHSNNVTVVSERLAFGDIPEHSTTLSINTFTVQISLGQTLDPGTLSWDIESQGTPQTVSFQDSGSYDYATGDGVFTGTFAPIISGTYTAVLKATGTSNSGIPFSRRASTHFRVSDPLAAFSNNGFSDTPQLDGNGKVAAVSINANTSVQSSDTYTFSVSLVAGTNVVQESSTVALSSGQQQISVIFPASDLLLLGADGPYEITDAILIRANDDTVAAYQADAGPTSAYNLANVDQGPLYFTGQNSATGIDSTGSGTFDTLRVQSGVFTPADSCTWSAYLSTPTGTRIDTTFGSGTFPAGNNNVTFDFDGTKIAQVGLDGPYTVSATVTCDTASAASVSVFQTGPFTASQFRYVPAGFTLSLPTSSGTVGGLFPSYVMVNVNAVGTFNGLVTLSMTGLPAGVTSSVSPNGTIGSGQSIFTLGAVSSAVNGVYSISIVGTSGTITQTIPFALTVTGGSGGSPVSVSVAPTAAALSASQTQQFTATVTNTSNTAVTWSISPAGVGSIDNTGLYTAPATIAAAQNVTVTATSAADTTASASATVTLSPSTGGAVSVTVTPTGATLAASQTEQFTATVANASNTSVTWSTNPSGVGSIDNTGLFTAPASVSSSQSITVTATSVADTTASGSGIVTLSPLAPTSAIRVNAGGSAYTDTQGRVWSADSGFSGGNTYSVTSSISGTNMPTLYQSERYGAFTYQFSVANGNYNVNLKFAELYFTSAGNRIFSVSINGQSVLTNFDVVAAAGARFTALDRAFSVNVTNGQIAIQFTPGQADPTVNAIEITPQTGVGVAVSPTNVTLGASQSQAFTATVTGTTNTDVSWSLYPTTGSISSTGVYTAPASVTTAQTVTVTATTVADQFATASATITLVPSGAIRVNAGGPAYTDPQGRVWSADNGFSGGTPYSVTSSISGTNTPTLYQTERYGAQTYQFAVLNGSYTVNLKFAELYFTQSGSRIFNVLINGQAALMNFDVVAAAGAGLTAVDRPFTVNVTDGQITIQLTAVQNDPTINAIEISPVTVSPSTVTVAASQSQAFTANVTGFSNTNVTWTLSPSVGNLTADGVYTAPASITSSQTVNVMATSIADPNSSASATVNLLVPGAIRVNAGGSAYTDTQGRVWSADNGFSGGNTYSVTSSISGTSTPTLYQSERYGAFTYQFSVANGNYNVNLKFAELYFTSAGNRIFSVSINGQSVLTNFDVVAAAGARFTALDRAFSVNVTNGQIAIQFTPGQADPTVNAIEITPQTGVGVAVSPTNVTLGASQSQAFTATVTGTTNTDVSWSLYPTTGSISSTGVYTAPASVTTAQTVTVTATSVADQFATASATITLVPSGAIRVNAGGPAYTDPQGRVWSADNGFSGGTPYSVTSSISGTNTYKRRMQNRPVNAA